MRGRAAMENDKKIQDNELTKFNVYIQNIDKFRGANKVDMPIKNFYYLPCDGVIPVE